MASFTIAQTNNRSILRDKFFGDIAGLSNFQVTLNGDSRAFGTFENDPFNLTSGVALSTGRVADLVGANAEDGGLVPSGSTDLSIDFGAPGSPGDEITLQIDFISDGSKDKIYFQYVFGSEEFLEYAGQPFNDSFSLSLNGQNLAILPGEGTDPNGDREVNINNLAGSPVGPFAKDPRYVGQNFLQYNSVAEGAVQGQTRLDGYTLPFTFEGELNDGANTLIITVKDVNDGQYDSAIFLKADTFGTTRPADIVIPGLTPTTPNAAPVAVDVTAAVNKTTINLTGLSATDSDGSISSYAILTLPDPAQGTLFFGDPALNGTPLIAGQPLPPTLIGQLFFQPTANFTGSSFTYTATDDKGLEDATPATVKLTGEGGPNPKPESPNCKPGKQLQGDKQNNQLEGTADSDSISGLEGNDTIKGGACNDVLSGGHGNDQLFGGTEADLLRGQQNDDIVKGETGNDRLNGGLGKDQLFGNEGDDLLFGRRGKDQLSGDTGADRLIGGHGLDELAGGAGTDQLFGRQKHDLLNGNDGNDFLAGNLGNDVLLGGQGQDILLGRRGADILTGGSETDQFVFFSLKGGVDTITDFSVKDNDRIVISAKGFGKDLKIGKLSTDQFTIGSSATAGNHRFIYNSSRDQLFFDADGEGKIGQIQIATLAKGLTLTSRNIVITA